MSMTKLELEAEIIKLKAEKAELLKAERSIITFKVSAKGAVSMYGMGRFPVTLYKQQWEKLLDVENVISIKAFIAANSHLLTTK